MSHRFLSHTNLLHNNTMWLYNELQDEVLNQILYFKITLASVVVATAGRLVVGWW